MHVFQGKHELRADCGHIMREGYLILRRKIIEDLVIASLELWATPFNALLKLPRKF